MPPEVLILSADGARIEQVLVNLLINAIKYSPASDRIIVTIRREANKAIVSVKDFGIGIAPEFQDKIFSRYFRINPSSTIGGLGIGLYISKEIINRHGGNIWAESAQDKGSTFYFSLPLPD
jgi:signal transduction histidine kinase